MKLPRARTLLIASAVAAPLAVGGFVIQERQAQNGVRLFQQVISIVNDRYVDSMSVGNLYEKAARGLVAELKDPYAELYTPKDLELFNQNTGGFYAGVGMSIESQDGVITVARVFPHTPSERAGIRVGDKIIGVDTMSVRNWKTDQVSAVLKGEPGTQVSAKFLRPGVTEPFEVKFTREVIRIPSVPYAIMLDGKVGYIPLQSFSETAAAEVRESLSRLVKEGAKGVVLDLRGNPGGFLEQADTLANLFLAKGEEIVSVRQRGEPTVTHVTTQTPVAPSLPVVVLTDGRTASASEIVAGALQDHDRALILGTTSFGKGLVQSMWRLDGGYAIKLTTAKWYTPSGRSIQRERKLTDDGQLIEVHPDSLETDSSRAARPKYKSDAGRVVYGGGAITPDVIVKYDTITSVEQQLDRALAVKPQETYLALYDYAFDMSKKVKPDFVVTPEMRDAFFQALVKRGVTVDRKQYDAAQGYVDRLIDGRISSLAFGDSTAKRRFVKDDAQLRKALDLLRRGSSTKDLLAMAGGAPAPAKPERH
ncbi:MAG TPA: S41 family peptidase [Gemmatimonadaceae bacterium]|nr:S41 family peptidase [Gemmatimonadaceae bacterium]